jgi:hypothetical protein
MVEGMMIENSKFNRVRLQKAVTTLASRGVFAGTSSWKYLAGVG